VVIAARTVLAWQTLVSREKDPLDPGVVTVGSIHGGTKYNIIPDEVKLQLTVRSFRPEVRKLLLDGIGRIAKQEAAAAPTANCARSRVSAWCSISWPRRPRKAPPASKAQRTRDSAKLEPPMDDDEVPFRHDRARSARAAAGGHPHALRLRTAGGRRIGRASSSAHRTVSAA
jgi:metal-dependent amidase/aminoacylase/carboxypeptidase family protein